MAQQHINIGTPNNQDGDFVRDAFSYSEDNFTELYARTFRAGNAVLAGGIVHLQNLDYYVWSSAYIINNVFYNDLVSGIVTLSAGDLLDPRIDVFTVNSNTQAEGSVTLNTGASGSVDSITVDGVELLSSPINYLTSLTVTANQIVNEINSNNTTPNYFARNTGGVITIEAADGGTTPNGFVVLSSATTITTTDVNLSGGSDNASVGSVTGMPNASPVKPDINLDYQAEVSFKLLQSGITADSDVTTILIYDENAGTPTEWDNATLPVGGNLTDSTNPFRNTVSINIPATSSSFLRFNAGTTLPNNDTPGNNIVFAIRTSAAWTTSGPNSSRLRVKIGSGGSSTSINFTANSISGYGFQHTQTNVWQLVIVPIANFSHHFDTIQYIEFEFTNTPTLNLDWINGQVGLQEVTPELSYLDLIDTLDTTYVSKDGFIPIVDETNNQLVLGPIPSGTASNGLNKVGNDTRLGGTLIEPTTINLTGTNNLIFDGDANLLRINSGFGNSLIIDNGTSGTPMSILNQSNTANLSLSKVSSNTNTLEPIIFKVGGSTGTVDTGFGIYEQTQLHNTVGAQTLVLQENIYWHDIGTLEPALSFTLATNLVPVEVFKLRGNGTLILTAYGSGTKTGTATYSLAVDANGNIIEEALSSSFDYSEWATYSGTRAGVDLNLTLGDYDNSGNGTKFNIDDATGIITFSSVSTLSISSDITTDTNFYIDGALGARTLGYLGTTFNQQLQFNNTLTTHSTLTLPDSGVTERIIPVSVNGNFADSSGNITVSSGAFETINEGSGLGIVRTGRLAANYGNIGLNAVDASISTGASSTRGATGTSSFAVGEDVTAAGYAAMVLGESSSALGNDSLVAGYLNTVKGYGSMVLGTQHTVEGITTSNNATAFHTVGGINNDVAGDNVSAFGKALFAKGNSLAVVGSANNATTYSFIAANAGPRFIVGIGETNPTTHLATARKNGLEVWKNGDVIATSLTIALIDAEATGRVLTTREWIEANYGTTPPDLQFVTTNGNSTDTNIEIENNAQRWFQVSNVGFTTGSYIDNTGYVNLINGDTLIDIDASARSIYFGEGFFTTQLFATEPTSNNVVTIQNDSGTLAFLGDVPSNLDEVLTGGNTSNLAIQLTTAGSTVMDIDATNGFVYETGGTTRVTILPSSVTTREDGVGYCEITGSVFRSVYLNSFRTINIQRPTTEPSANVNVTLPSQTGTMLVNSSVSASVATSRNFVLSDANNIVTLNNASPVTATIPANSSVAFPVGTKITVINLGAGTVTIGITTDTLNQNVGGLTLAQYSKRTLIKVATTSWILGN